MSQSDFSVHIYTHIHAVIGKIPLAKESTSSTGVFLIFPSFDFIPDPSTRSASGSAYSSISSEDVNAETS